MEPMTIALLAAAAAQVVSGLMQHYQSEKARKASNQRLKEIEAMFDAIVPPEFDLKVYDDPALAKNIPPPALNMEAITPEMYQRVGQYVPTIADIVRETDPKLVKATEVAQKGREAQLDALERYKQIASGQFDPALAQKLDQASLRARSDAQSRQDSILQDAQRRGQFGSGLMQASQMNAAAEAMRRQALESQMAAAESYRNQISALDKSADLGGDIRRSEMDEQARNVGIINDFNQRTSKNFQDWLYQRASLENEAKIRNLSEAQRIADANVGLNNRAKQEQVERYNSGQKTLYDVASRERQNKLDVLDKKNRLKQQMYENLITKAQGKAGLGQVQINNILQDARDKNQATRGIADAVSAGAMYYGANAKRSPEQELGMDGDLQMNNQYDYDTYPGQKYRYSPTDRWRTS